MFTTIYDGHGHGTSYATTNSFIDSQKSIEDLEAQILLERQTNDMPTGYSKVLLTSWKLLNA